MANKNILSLLCKKSRISYILFDKDFKIIQFDTNLSLLSNNSKELKIDADIREAFWEFIGIENNILNLLDSDKFSIKIPMICKNHKYYDIEIEIYDKSTKLFISYITQKADFSIEYLKTIKKLNKKILTLQTNEINLERERNDCDLINQNIISFHADANGIITAVNSVCIYFLGEEENNIVGKHFSVFFHTRDSSLADNRSKIFHAKSAQNRDIFLHANVIPIKDNDIHESIIVCQDITYLKKVTHELGQAKNYDTLTGLVNYSYLIKNIDEIIKSCKDNTNTFSICLIDLDDFKLINKNYGSHAGDMILKEISSTLSNFVRDFDTVARISDDKFIILFNHIKDERYLDSALQRIKKLPQLNSLIYNQDTSINFEFSLSISSFPKNANNTQDLLNYANEKMQAIKIEKKGIRN